MSKIVCDICGTTYDDSTGACPVCGWNPGATLDPSSASEDDILTEDLQLDEELNFDNPAQKNKAVFDYDAVNTGHRRSQKSEPAQTPEPVPQEDSEEEESGSNKFLVFILVVLILALLVVSGYIAYTKLWKPSQVGSDDNKPSDTVTAEVVDSTDENGETVSAVEGETAGETTADASAVTEEAATEATIPCTNLSLVASIDELTFSGQLWRLMVKCTPDDTTDTVTYTSGDESVVTVDENGRVTAVGEGETVIVITCGSQRIETPAVVKYASEETEAATTATTAEGVSGTGTGTGTVATPSSGVVLKLTKTDITISRRGVYVTLELENGLSAEDVTWSTTDSSVATVYNGNVTAVGKGTCVIRAEYEGQTVECIVRCKF